MHRPRARTARTLAVVLTLVLAGCGGVSLPATPSADGQTTVSPGGTAPASVPDDPGVPSDGRTWQATVTRVVDGDTVEVRYANGTTDTVRLVGVDTPETHGDTTPSEFEGVPDTEAGRACLADAGDRAASALADWVNGTEVTLVHDPETDRRDRYDRLLAYVVSDGATVNYRLVARGHARVYDTSFTRAETYYAAEAAVRGAARGLWGCTDPAARQGSGALSVRVVADAPGNDNEHLNGEYVVLANRGEHAVALGGWTVADAAGHRFDFPPNATIPADGAVRVYSGARTANATAFYWGSDGAVWNNDGDTVTVRDANGTLVVQRSY